MVNFYVHFFAEINKKVNFEEIANFLFKRDGFSQEETKEDYVLRYTHPQLRSFCVYRFMNYSSIFDLSKISPKYQSLNLRLEVPIVSPSYMVQKFFETARTLANEFSLYVYNEFMENVCPFNFDLVYKTFSLAKGQFEKLNPPELKNYTHMHSSELSHILRYEDELVGLKSHFAGFPLFIPHFIVLQDQNAKTYTAIEWKEDSATVFPAKLDLVIYQAQSGIKVVEFDQVKHLIDKYLLTVPGFMAGTKYIDPKMMRKVSKKMKKVRPSGDFKELNRIELNHLID